jgi:hypothetical protein
MSTPAKALLTIVTLSVVAGGVGLVSTSDESPVDRSRPVIIGRVGDVDDDRARGGDDQPRDDQPRQESPAPQEDPAPSPRVVTPKPRDLTPDDDLDAPEDGDDTDAGEDGQDDDSSGGDDDDDAGEGGDD